MVGRVDGISTASALAQTNEDDQQNKHSNKQDNCTRGGDPELPAISVVIIILMVVAGAGAGRAGGFDRAAGLGVRDEERHHNDRVPLGRIAAIDGDKSVVEVKNCSRDSGEFIILPAIAIDGEILVLLITEDCKSKLRGARSIHLFSAGQTMLSAVADKLVDILEVVVSVLVAVKVRLTRLDGDDVNVATGFVSVRIVRSHLSVVELVAVDAADAHGKAESRLRSGLGQTVDGILNAGCSKDVTVDEVTAELARGARDGVQTVAGGHNTLVVVAEGEANRACRIGKGSDVGCASLGEGHVLMEDEAEGLVGRSPVLVVSNEGDTFVITRVVDDIEAVFVVVMRVVAGERLDFRTKHQKNSIVGLQTSTLCDTKDLIEDIRICLLVGNVELLPLVGMLLHPRLKTSPQRVISFQQLSESILLLNTNAHTQIEGGVAHSIVRRHSRICHSKGRTSDHRNKQQNTIHPQHRKKKRTVQSLTKKKKKIYCLYDEFYH